MCLLRCVYSGVSAWGGPAGGPGRPLWDVGELRGPQVPGLALVVCQLLCPPQATGGLHCLKPPQKGLMRQRERFSEDVLFVFGLGKTMIYIGLRQWNNLPWIYTREGGHRPRQITATLGSCFERKKGIKGDDTFTPKTRFKTCAHRK